MQKSDSLLHDPLFYITVGLFALLTTGLAAALGQPRFLPISQTVALFAFLVVALRRQLVREALWILALWLVVQWIVIMLVTRLAPAQVEQVFSDGFRYRTSYIGWYHGAEPLPRGLNLAPGARLLEMTGVVLGSLVSGGLVGLWFLLRATNLAGYSAGLLWQDSKQIIDLLGGLQPWTMLRLAGYAGLLVVLALPIFSGVWSPGHYLTQYRRHLLISLALVVAGLLLELLLAGLWRSLFT
jgi:hypothetical protein